jgi:hypothetical protein
MNVMRHEQASGVARVVLLNDERASRVANVADPEATAAARPDSDMFCNGMNVIKQIQFPLDQHNSSSPGCRRPQILTISAR